MWPFSHKRVSASETERLSELHCLEHCHYPTGCETCMDRGLKCVFGQPDLGRVFCGRCGHGNTGSIYAANCALDD